MAKKEEPIASAHDAVSFLSTTDRLVGNAADDSYVIVDEPAESSYMYTLNVPITPHGLLLQIGSRAGCLIFDGYVAQPTDGKPGPAEMQKLFHRRGDLITKIEGVEVTGKSFRGEIIPLIKKLIAEKEEVGRTGIEMRVCDGREWWRQRRNNTNRSNKPLQKSKTMALDEAYEAIEEMRRLNLEVEFAERIASGEQIDLNACTQCLRSSIGETTQKLQPDKNILGFDGHRIRNAKDRLTRPSASPCLICWSPVCKAHSCDGFRKEGITVCRECSHLFSLDFILACVSHADECHTSSSTNLAKGNAHLDRLVDIYDRVLLILRYSMQYAEDIAVSLERKSKRNNHIGLGSNVTGIVSGATGIAAAATIFTPAGPPLIIASLLFGGTATAVSTGSEAVHYFSEPRKVADKVIALHGVASSLLRVTGVLRDALLRDHIRVDHYLEDDKEDPETDAEKVVATLEEVKESMEKEHVRTITKTTTASAKYIGAATEIGALATSSELAAAEVGVLAARNSSRFFSRATSTAMRTARFARFAGGFLSAATVAIEAKDMHSTIQAIQAGSPSEKAQMVRSIMKQLGGFPNTVDVHKQVEKYFAAVSKRREEERVHAQHGNMCMYPEVERLLFSSLRP